MTDPGPLPLAMTDVSLGVLLAATAWLAAGTVLQAMHRLSRRHALRLPARARAAYLLTLCVLPAAIAVAAALLMLSSHAAGLLVSPHCHATVGCTDHAPSAVVASHWPGLAVISLCVVLVLAIRVQRQFGRYLRRRRQLADVGWHSGPHGARLIDSPELLAFSFGLMRPEVYLTRGLMNQLNDEQLAAVMAHEQVHCANRDGLRQFLVQLLFPPTGLHNTLADDLRAAAEQRADSIAARGAVQRLSLAETLVHVQRLAMQRASGVGRIDAGLEQRVQALLNPGIERWAYRLAPVSITVLLVLALLMGIDGAHSVIESILMAGGSALDFPSP